jgi:hypothetical protein
VKGDASRYLASLGGRLFIADNWIQKDFLARHLIWITEIRDVQYKGRFGVLPDAKMSTKILINSPSRAAFCEWLMAWLQEPSKLIPAPGVPALQFEDDTLYINTTLMWQKWDMYIQKMKPSLMQLTETAKSMSVSSVKLGHYQVFGISLNMVQTWAKLSGIAEDSVKVMLEKACSVASTN